MLAFICGFWGWGGKIIHKSVGTIRKKDHWEREQKY